MSYTDFFNRATRTEERPDGLKPFPYQRRLAEEPFRYQGMRDPLFIEPRIRVINLPELDQTPNPGEATARYLTAVRK